MALATLACLDKTARSPFKAVCVYPETEFAPRTGRFPMSLRQIKRKPLQPALEIFDQGGREALSGLQPVLRGKAVDAALDIEQHIDAPDGLEGDGRDFLVCLALSNVAFDIGQFEELAACMAPAERGSDRRGSSRCAVKLVIKRFAFILNQNSPQEPGDFRCPCVR